MTRISAVLVAYSPAAGQLARAISAIVFQVDRVFVVCNSTIDDSQMPEGIEDKLEVIRNPTNIGLAAAQNIGLRRCVDQNADFVLFLDQDSIAPADMVERLLAIYRRLTYAGTRVAAVAPLLVDADTGDEWPFLSTRWIHTHQTATPDEHGACAADFLYSSGSIVTMAAFLRVGGFIESLFIDHVDLEWCMRARTNGYLCFGAPGVRMLHRMGSGHVRMFGRHHAIHAAARDYYVFRNSISLMKLPYIPLRWKLNEAVRLIPRALFYSALHPKPLSHFAACLSGIRAGFRMRPLEPGQPIHG